MKYLKGAGWLKTTVYGLMLAGVINFLLGDIFGFNPLDETLGRDSVLALTVYTVIGLSVLYVFYDLAASLRKDR